MYEPKVKKVAFVASVYRHFVAFHLPFMEILQQMGVQVHAFASDDGTKHQVEAHGVRCHVVDIRRNPLQLSNLKAFKQLLKGFSDEQFAMIHVHTPVASILGRVAAKIAGVPQVIYTAHGFHFFTGASKMNWALYYTIERIMAHLTDHLITINEEDYQRAQTFFVKREVHFVPGVGVNTTSYCKDEERVRWNVRKQLGIENEDFVILCVAELNMNKNQQQLLEAIKILNDRGIHVRCLLVGSGEMEKSLGESVQKWKLEEQVHFLGFRSDIPELLAAADVCTLVSKREGLPRSLLEAMAAGKPIVTTNTRGNRDLVSHGESGFIVPIADSQQTADAFQTLFEDSQLCERMGEKSQELVQQYDIRHVLHRMKQIYEESLV